MGVYGSPYDLSRSPYKTWGRFLENPCVRRLARAAQSAPPQPTFRETSTCFDS